MRGKEEEGEGEGEEEGKTGEKEKVCMFSMNIPSQMDTEENS